MLIPYWLLLLAAVVLLCMRRSLLRIAALALKGRTLRWPVRVGARGRLRAGIFRLRLYGLQEFADDARAIALLNRRLERAPPGWRVLAIDHDGTLAILLRADRKNLAVELLRSGLASVRGCGARRLRLAQEQARVQAKGGWPPADPGCRCARDDAARLPFLFPWWQG